MSDSLSSKTEVALSKLEETAKTTSAMIERFLVALEAIAELRDKTLLGGHGLLPARAYEHGAAAAFNQAADIARKALKP